MMFNVSAAVLVTLSFSAHALAQDAAAVAEVEGRRSDTPTTQPAAEPAQGKAAAPTGARVLPPVEIGPLIRRERETPKRQLLLGGAGLRGGGGGQLQAVVPEDGGVTARAHPTLYFHLSEPANGEVVATLTKGQEPEPVKEWKLSNLGAGMHALEMKEADPALEVDAEYSWVVTVRKYRSASKNPLIQTSLIRVKSTPQVAGASPADRVAHLADAGLWYDAVDELLKEPSAHPGAERASKYRGELRQALELQRTRHAPTTSLR